MANKSRAYSHTYFGITPHRQEICKGHCKPLISERLFTQIIFEQYPAQELYVQINGRSGTLFSESPC